MLRKRDSGYLKQRYQKDTQKGENGSPSKDVDLLVIGTSYILGRWVILGTIVLMYFAMPPQVGHNGEMTAAALYFACERCEVLVGTNVNESL